MSDIKLSDTKLSGTKIPGAKLTGAKSPTSNLPKIRQVQLFTTLGCHLCEEANDQLLVLQKEGLAIEICAVEIADSEDLLHRYGIRIPVIAIAEDEIDWSFSIDQLRSFLRNV